MIALVHGAGRFARNALALALGMALSFHLPSAPAVGGWFDGKGQMGGQMGPTPGTGRRDGRPLIHGTLSYGGANLYPGFYGFGLAFHPGYGYGGDSLGTGALGGDPYYGGPGYYHEGPPLHRLGRIIPFPYYAGPGYPFSFDGPGALFVDQPVVNETSPLDFGLAGDFGCFTGSRPYPEVSFAPYASAAGAGESVAAATSPSPSTTAPNSVQARDLGIDEEPIISVNGVPATRVANVYPGTPAKRAGLQIGDVIVSINGHRTQPPGSLAWIIAHAAPNYVLNMIVRKASDGREQTITVQLP